MTLLLWGALALIAGLAVPALAILFLARRPRDAAPDEELPVTPLQRLARRVLALGVTLSAAAAALVVVFGPERALADDGPRIGFELIVVAVLGLLLYLTARAWSWSRRDDGTLDERDRAILSGAHGIQAVAMLVTLAVWTIGLQEQYQAGDGLVPAPLLGLVFWSCVVACVLSLPVGILLGYRRG